MGQFMDLIFPLNINCIFCNDPISKKNPYSICKKCYYEMNFLKEVCPKCGRSGEHSNLCTDCHGEYYYFDKVISLLEYNDFFHTYIYSYKYGHKPYMSREFGAMCKDYLVDRELKFDFIMGVPISKKRMSQRGFNQTYLIAEHLVSQGEYIELFKRTKNTRFLSKLSKVERNRELDGAFEIREEALDYMMNKIYTSDDLDIKINICIFDDIFTTGSTVNELSKLIKKNIANTHITIFTLCNARKINK